MENHEEGVGLLCYSSIIAQFISGLSHGTIGNTVQIHDSAWPAFSKCRPSVAIRDCVSRFKKLL